MRLAKISVYLFQKFIAGINNNVVRNIIDECIKSTQHYFSNIHEYLKHFEDTHEGIKQYYVQKIEELQVRRNK